jgi:hypothetical protein
MKWSDIRETYPERQWMVLEVLASHRENERLHLDDVSVVEVCADSASAFEAYRRLRRQYAPRHFVFMCTDREELDLEILPTAGLRRFHATRPEGVACCSRA